MSELFNPRPHMARQQTKGTGMPRKSKHNAYTPEQWQERCEEFANWARGRTAARHSFTRRDVIKDFGIGSTTAQRLIQWAIERGLVIDMGKKGYAATGTVYRAVTLADLLRLAEEAVSDELTVGPGRRGVEASREVERITKSQRDRIRTLARNLAMAVAGDKRRLSEVNDQGLWAWDDTGVGEWALLSIVAGLARTHEWAHVSQHIGAAKNMLDLAATRGLLPRSARHSQEWSCHAAEWEPHVQRWAGRILRQSGGRSKRKVLQGARTLALYATRRGELSPLSANWLAIRDQLTEERRRDAITADVYTWARYVYRRIRAIRRLPDSAWDTQPDRRVTLVPKAVAAASAAGASSGQPDFSAWRCRISGAYPAALIEGAVSPDDSGTRTAYGLAPWIVWATVPMTADLDARNLPHRVWPNPTDRQRLRIVREPNLLRLEPGVAQQRLQGFSLVAGWAEENEGVDWSTSDLSRLVDHNLILRWGRATATKPNKSALVSSVCFALGTLASPFLEAQALRAGELDSAQYFREAAGHLKAQGAEWRDEDGPKDITAIEAAWDNGADEGGWVRLGQLREVCIAEAVRRAGGLTLRDQIEHVRSGQDGWGERWAVALRMAVLLTLVRRVPLRGRAISGLKLNMWVPRPAGQWSKEAGLAPWESAIQIVVPAELTKSKKRYRPFLIHVRRVGEPRQERELNRELLELYFMPNGARDEILSVCSYEYRGSKRVVVDRVTYKSDFVFPALARRGGGHGDMEALQTARKTSGFPWEVGALSTHFSDFVLRNAEAIGMNQKSLDDEWGATSIHTVRLLFGTYWAARMNKLDWASKLLHHAHPHVTAARYCGASAETTDLDDELVRPARKTRVETAETTKQVAADTGQEKAEGIVEIVEAIRTRLEQAGLEGDLLKQAVQIEFARFLRAA